MIKEVKKLSKEKFYLFILERLQKGDNPTKICKDLNISKQKLNYYLRGLKDKDLIKKVGYGTWNVVKTSKNYPKHPQDLKEIRGHAFIWKIRIPNNVVAKWKIRLVALKIPYKITGIHQVPMIEVAGRKVLLGDKHIIVYEKIGFLGCNAIESRKEAIIDLQDILRKMEVKLNINLQPYLFTVRREHYAIINNLLAEHCNDTKSPIKIKDIHGYWLLTDASLNQDELENIGKEAFNINLPMQDWWNDHKKQGFKVTPSFTLEALNKVTQNQVMFAKNIDKHMEVLEGIQEAITELKDTVKAKK